MNNYTYPPRMVAFVCAAFFLFTIPIQAQLYIDFSSNLPNDGASGQSVDVQSIDMDNDGDPDIVLANEYQPNVLLVNTGTGFFVKAPNGTIPLVVHDSEDIAIADYNNDGLKDIVFVSEDDFEHEYYLNNGANMYSFKQFLPFTACNAVVSGDINNDNHPDLLLGNLGQNLLLVNDGTGGLINETPFRLPNAWDSTHDVKLIDVDNDGDQDVFLGNEQDNLLYINDGAGHFADQSSFRLPQGLPIDTRKVSFADVDNDGDQDIFLSTVEFQRGKDPQNRLFLNNGEGYFTDFTDTHLPLVKDQTLDAAFLDIDNDNDLDLVIGGVLLQPLKFYLNNGSGVFKDETIAVMGSYDFYTGTLDALGISINDMNGDGFKDIYVCNRAGKDLLLLRDPNAIITSNKEVETFAFSVRLFPNPVQQQLTVELGQDFDEMPQFSLSDATGRWLGALSSIKQQSGAFQIDLSANALPSGMYFLQIQLNGAILSRKLMLE